MENDSLMSECDELVQQIGERIHELIPKLLVLGRDFETARILSGYSTITDNWGYIKKHAQIRRTEDETV